MWALACVKTRQDRLRGWIAKFERPKRREKIPKIHSRRQLFLLTNRSTYPTLLPFLGNFTPLLLRIPTTVLRSTILTSSFSLFRHENRSPTDDVGSGVDLLQELLDGGINFLMGVRVTYVHTYTQKEVL